MPREQRETVMLTSDENQPLTKKMRKSYTEIWSVQTKAVILQPLSGKRTPLIKEELKKKAKVVIERLINQDVVQASTEEYSGKQEVPVKYT